MHRSLFPCASAASLALCTLIGCSQSPTANPDASDVAPSDVQSTDTQPDDAVNADGAMPVDGTGDDAPVVDVVDAAPFDVAMHTPLPSVPNQGGAIIANPTVVTITYANDPNRTTFENMARWMVGSQWLQTVGAEYGIGPGTAADPVRRTDDAPTTQTSTQIEAMLAQGITDGSIPTPAAGLANTIFMLYFPRGTAVTLLEPPNTTYHVCTDVLGYHSEVHTGSLDFVYTVSVDCNITAIRGLTPMEVEEQTASHEFMEAASNPFPATNPAYSWVQGDTTAWVFLGPEIGDLCARPHFWIREGGFVAQRIWSNQAAAMGGDPCIPLDPALTYFNTDAQPSDLVHATPGQTLMYSLAGWSLGPVPDWPVTTRVEGTVTPTIAPPTIMLNNGQTAMLSVTVPTTARRGDYAVITLSSGSGTTNYHTAAIGFYIF